MRAMADTGAQAAEVAESGHGAWAAADLYNLNMRAMLNLVIVYTSAPLDALARESG